MTGMGPLRLTSATDRSEFDCVMDHMKEKTIYALGFFDGVHLGHGALLKTCRDMADAMGIRAGAVTFTAHPDTLVLGRTPALINTPEDRKMLLLSQYHMDTVVELPFDKQLMAMPWMDFISLLCREYGAAGFVCGHDFRFGHGGKGDADALEKHCRGAGLPCTVVPEQKLEGVTVSSTHIRGLLAQGEMETAVRFLGHPHILTGTVVSGRGVGRTIGVPTANLQLPEGVLCPKHGVYACMAVVDGTPLPAVTNIGSRPTVGGHRVTVEPWILNYTGDLYGKTLTLEFYRFLREERKFNSLEELRSQIQKNAAQTLDFFGKS